MASRRAAYDEKRRAVVRAAQELSVRDGYEGLTVDDVIAAAGISKGTFYHYFPSKDELLEAALLDATTALAEQVRTAIAGAGDGAIARLEAFLALARPGATGRAADERALGQMLLATPELAALRTRAHADLTRRLAPQLAAVLSDGARERRFDVAQPGPTAELIVALTLATRVRVLTSAHAPAPDAQQLDAQPLDTVRSPDADVWVDTFLTIVERALALPATTLHRDGPADRLEGRDDQA